MPIWIINSEHAPKAASYFSHGVVHKDSYVVELSGQIGLDPKTGKLVDGGIVAQTERTFANIEAILSAIGWDLRNLIKCRVYLTNMDDYAEMNGAYARLFQHDPPARVTVGVERLPLGASIEIECVAAGDSYSGDIKTNQAR